MVDGVLCKTRFDKKLNIVSVHILNDEGDTIYKTYFDVDENGNAIESPPSKYTDRKISALIKEYSLNKGL
jgi:hypothetical protein